MVENAEALPFWYAIIAGVVGLVLILAGYRLLRMAARFAAALLGAAIGMAIGAHTGYPLVAVASGVGLGIVGFLLGDIFYYINMALNGASAGLFLAALIATVAGFELGLVVAIAGIVVGAVLGVLLERPIGIFGTSVIGGALLSVSAQIGVASAGVEEPAKYGFAYLLLFVGTAVAGCILQALTTRNLPEKPKEKGKRGKAKA